MSSSRDDFGIAIRSALLQRGARQKFSLFFLICLSILIFFLDSLASKYMNGVRAVLNDGIYRVSSISTSPFKFISYINTKGKEHFFIYKENEVLKNELESLRKKDFNLNFLTAENRRLKETLESENNLSIESQTAKVILDKKSPFLKSIILNKGTKSRIRKGMPVLEGNYLVGRIVEANYLSSRVLLLNDLNSKIPVVLGSISAQAIIAGTGIDKPTLQYLPESFSPSAGTTVFTSGKDGIFPAGIPIGKVILKDNNILINLFSDPNQLAFVNVILNTSMDLDNF
jgi:rod shape-determining protein MreC